MGKIDIQELTNACNLLGLNPADFIESQEVEKGVEGLDYKALYEQQRDLNIKLLQSIGTIPSIIEKGISEKITELKDNESLNIIKEVQKSISNIEEKINLFGESPIHQAKAFRGIAAVEKGISDNLNGAKDSYSLSNPIQVKKLKALLGQKTFECLEKGINDSIYEKATMQLDASKTLRSEIRQKLFESDKIAIVD